MWGDCPKVRLYGVTEPRGVETEVSEGGGRFCGTACGCLDGVEDPLIVPVTVFMNKPGIPGRLAAGVGSAEEAEEAEAGVRGCWTAFCKGTGFGAVLELLEVCLLWALRASNRCLISSVCRAFCSSVTGGFRVGVVVAWGVLMPVAGEATAAGGEFCGGSTLAGPDCLASLAACRRAR